MAKPTPPADSNLPSNDPRHSGSRPPSGEPTTPGAGPGPKARTDKTPDALSKQLLRGATALGIESEPQAPEEKTSFWDATKLMLFGKPRDLSDKSIYQHLALVAFLAWVGLGADGLSSSCYGPAEAFVNLGQHTYLAVFLALATVVTVFLISACYSHIIEEFPSGGGGYAVASALLGPKAGVLSGCALLVDYVLTITVSIAAAGDALFGLLGPEWALWGFSPSQTKLYAEIGVIVLLMVLNLRGIKESVLVLLPIFLIFLATHAILIAGVAILDFSKAGEVAHQTVQGVSSGVATFGILALLGKFLHAYSLGAGTYTGIEAVSNSMLVLREPRVTTGKRTMNYMAVSLAITAGGLLLGYLLLGIQPVKDKTMNHLLTEGFVNHLGLSGSWVGGTFVVVTLLSEGALLFVAAQAGFIGGPRLLANMARDSWVPHWFSNLSERLASRNGVLLMGLSALAALWYTHGNVSALVIMYSINVFVTFSLSMLGMCRYWHRHRGESKIWRRRFALFLLGAAVCLGILCVTVIEKFHEGGWRTLAVTGLCVAVCLLIRRYYRQVTGKLKRLDELLASLPSSGAPNTAEPNPDQPAAVILVGGYNGLGVHTLLNAIRFVPNYFQSLVFVSVGVVDSGNFKGSRAVDDLRKHTEEILAKYVDFSRRLGLPAASFLAIGTDAVDELEQLCVDVRSKFPRSIFFAGQLVFQEDTWYQRLLHNETAFVLQRRLKWAGVPIVILPTRVS